MSNLVLEQKQATFRLLVAKYDIRSRPSTSQPNSRCALPAEERRATAPLSSARGQGFSLLR